MAQVDDKVAELNGICAGIMNAPKPAPPPPPPPPKPNKDKDKAETGEVSCHCLNFGRKTVL